MGGGGRDTSKGANTWEHYNFHYLNISPVREGLVTIGPTLLAYVQAFIDLRAPYDLGN